MLPIESSSILRIVIFSAFVGFVLFCASYATHVWLKRNTGSSSAASSLFKVGAGFLVAGLLGAGGSWTLNRFVDRSGIVDGGALFVVHARRDGHVVMSPRQEVRKGDVIAQFHPPALEDQLKVIDSRIGEAEARVEALRVRPLEIDPVILQGQEQLRAQLGQQRQFQVEFARARREHDRMRLEATARRERELIQIANEIAAARASLEGLQPQQRMASGRLARANALRRQGLATVQVLDERSSAVLGLALERKRLDSMTAGLTARLALVTQQNGRATAEFDVQRADLERRADETSQHLGRLEHALAGLAGEMELDRTRAAMRQEHEIEVARRHVATLTAERNRAISAQQIVAPFAGRIVYRSASPGLAADGVAVLAVSTGLGFVANIAMPQSEIDSVAAAGTVTFALDHPVLKKYFPGAFRTAEPGSLEPGRTVAVFDAQLPQDAIALLGVGREPMKVRLLWQPPLLQSSHLRTSLLVLALGALLMVLDRLRGSVRLPHLGQHEGKA